MARPKSKIEQKTLSKAKQELVSLKDGKLAIQLKAIIAANEYPVGSVAQIFQVSKRSVFRWIEKFIKDGVSGLKDRPKGHRVSKLTGEQKKEIERWILNGKTAKGGKVNWTLKKLKVEVDRVMNVTISTVALWNHMKSMNFVLKKPRPAHYKADKKRQDAFKKNP